jgi:hypothetical protein
MSGNPTILNEVFRGFSDPQDNAVIMRLTDRVSFQFLAISN